MLVGHVAASHVVSCSSRICYICSLQLYLEQASPPQATTPFLAAGGEGTEQGRGKRTLDQSAMEGNGGGGAPAPPCDLGMTYWAPCASTFPSPTGGQQQHLTCLKLGKRPCYWGEEYPEAAGGGVRVSADGGGAVGAPEGIRRQEKGVEVAPVPRCQVEGCHVALTGAKEYHRRHKVCEPHSKAPRVVVLGAEQRFCQQCSRFHAIAEFDDAKRSCRRRLAGHNERRRKSNAGEAAARLSAHPYGFPYFPTTSPSGALSLLSSRVTPWLIPTADVSARSSAALDELIAENRAAILAWQFFSDRSGRPAALTASCNAGMAGWPHGPHHCQLPPRPDHAGNGIGHVTLDLMQATTTGAPVRSVSDGSKTKDADADCYDIWKSLEGAHVV